MPFTRASTGYTVESGVVDDGAPCAEADCNNNTRYALRIVNAIPVDEIAALAQVFQKGRGGPKAYMKTGEKHFVFVGLLTCGHDAPEDEYDDPAYDENDDPADEPEDGASDDQEE